MSEDPKGATSTLLQWQAGTMESMLYAMHEDDKALVLDYLGLAVASEAPEGRRFGEEQAKKKGPEMRGT